MYRLNHNQDIIELLLKLKDFEAEYPRYLFFTRRSSFILLISRYTHYVASFLIKTPLK